LESYKLELDCDIHWPATIKLYWKNAKKCWPNL